MWSVSYHAPRTASESCYVIFGLWNRVASIYLQFLRCWHDIQQLFFLKLDLIYFLNVLNLQIWLLEPAGRTLSAWKLYRPSWRTLYWHYTNIDGRPAPGTARTRFCSPRRLNYSLLHCNWRQKISSLHYSWPCSQIQCASGRIPRWTSNLKKTHRNHTNTGTSQQYCTFPTFFSCCALTAF